MLGRFVWLNKMCGHPSLCPPSWQIWYFPILRVHLSSARLCLWYARPYWISSSSRSLFDAARKWTIFFIKSVERCKENRGKLRRFFFSFLLSREGQLKNVLYYNIKYNSIYGAKHNSKSNIVECFLLFSRRSLHWNWFNSIMNLIFRISLTWEQRRITILHSLR